MSALAGGKDIADMTNVARAAHTVDTAHTADARGIDPEIGTKPLAEKAEAGIKADTTTGTDATTAADEETKAASDELRPTHLILIGDSRTEGMAAYIGDVQGNFLNHWYYKTSSGYKYMAGSAFPFADTLIAQLLANDPEADIRLVCMFGMNDCYNVQKYAASMNTKAAELKALGVKTYFLSVNPIADEMSNYKYDKNEYAETFNATIQPLLSSDVLYIDSYSQILGEFRKWVSDGVHYRKEGCQRIYNIITEAVRAS